MTIPADVYGQLQRTAQAKACSVVELIPEMLPWYRHDWLKTYQAELQEYLKTLPPTPYTEADVPRLVREIRKELAAERQLESRP